MMRRICTPVWSVNASTAYQVKYNGKGKSADISVLYSRVEL